MCFEIINRSDPLDAEGKLKETIKVQSHPEVLDRYFIFEEISYMERSLADSIELLEVFVGAAGRRSEILAAARMGTERLGRERGESLEAIRCRSICRLNILEKSG